MTAPVRLVLVLHGHIPDVLGHGVWPHGANWLYEAAAETYLPFLRAFQERAGLEEFLVANGVRYFFVDTHLVRGGDWQVWWNGESARYWREVDDIEKQMQRFEARKDEIARGLFAGLDCQTLLVHSSDWPFLIDNEVSKDYAVGRIDRHVADFWTLAHLADEGGAGDPAETAIWDRERLFEPELRSR